MCAGAHGGQKRPFDTLELELHVVASYSVWVLGIELEYSRRAASVPNALSPTKWLLKDINYCPSVIDGDCSFVPNHPKSEYSITQKLY